MSERVSYLTFNNGLTCPAFGLSTGGISTHAAGRVIEDAIDAGYRVFDCAPIYGNQKEIGEAIRKKISSGVVNREELFIISKLWNTCHRPESVEPALRQTLDELGTGYVDLYVIHWPFAFQEGSNSMPLDPYTGKVLFGTVDYVDTWKAMETINRLQLAKSIGVSNFNKRQIDRILQDAVIAPAANQIECHPHLTQMKLSNFCKRKGIIVMAYGPLGSPKKDRASSDEPVLLDDPRLEQIAEMYKKTSAHVALRYQVQRGHIVLPVATSKDHLRSNFNIWDFELNRDDMYLIDSFNCNNRICHFPEAVDHKDYPFARNE